jgi:uncharacterized membrane protein YtjA (UPF0391 family)
MLSWPLAFLIIALLAALLGFTGIAGPTAWIAKGLSALFLVLFLRAITARWNADSKNAHTTKETK